ncbi:helix-turn-helix domain-containing protein [Vagococcus carniphilus]|uniref:helix-turn-helix domain-containing protein n=1 Tax=Vagococcus carniphilus TaxID=218144 RepID=UPI0028909B06|nr:helix-turn-helix domain-containing protein [Vagococcus carniphilus]MDT2813373.1 helix-turn-helix domain-containing protein [Vagococcus carniphilus]MDT2830173.1 helix-turn-helix domain-containing protein [Vagococcus carniphilus]MDT2838605.1 helix-turn-helix domain-containing protein [Vagococcus carniphilus]MDT2853443.1 helix-turn-helix domain-containing protein [Vagococcus carniphilus]MDT2865208.1 helix-turn-helix domain-containing protein [Vagococcus carniphilus]
MDISTKLKDKRKQVGLTQEQIAQKLHVSRQTISNWETGKSIPDIYSLVELSNIYDISLDNLIKEDVVMMKELKKENQEKKILNSGIIISGVGILMMLLSILIPNDHIQSFCNGFGVGLLITGSTVLILVKILRKLYQ